MGLGDDTALEGISVEGVTMRSAAALFDFLGMLCIPLYSVGIGVVLGRIISVFGLTFIHLWQFSRSSTIAAKGKEDEEDKGEEKEEEKGEKEEKKEEKEGGGEKEEKKEAGKEEKKEKGKTKKALGKIKEAFDVGSFIKKHWKRLVLLALEGVLGDFLPVCSIIVHMELKKSK